MEERLHFGRRARRRARRQRALRVAAFASMAAVAAGLPGSDFPFDTLNRIVGSQTRLVTGVRGVEATESAMASLKFRRKVFAARPTPTPSDPPDVLEDPPSAVEDPPTYGESITETIAAAAAEFGLSPDYLLSVAQCESNLDPSAVSPAGYYGLFQFDESTWAAYGYGPIYDPIAQARTAARLIAAGQSSRWPNCA